MRRAEGPPPEDAASSRERPRAAGRGGSLAVLQIDLNRFKQVNDQFGHHEGDRLLTTVAERLREAVPDPAFVARLGGDEFAVLLDRVREDADAVTVAERVLAALSPGFTVEGRRAFVGTSIGIARGGVGTDAGAADAAGDSGLALSGVSSPGGSEPVSCSICRSCSAFCSAFASSLGCASGAAD